MSSDYYKATGVDDAKDANLVFVWSRDRVSSEPMLLGAGYAVRADVVRPNGIKSGQFAITFSLPETCRRDDIFVTSDRAGDVVLSGAEISACSVPRGTQAPMMLSGAAAVHAADALVSHSQHMLANRAE
ncbi:hypothetical protein FHS85_002529 [Rhodoligotrophos appendicifer]|uniref:hypothetical protein n=1 Tax=Rhodoligotrophos appendicifer TaxID=987056 RepID=UPI001185C109|nr:hypothetical protein [Rhodoligotrophos appendicifer]